MIQQAIVVLIVAGALYWVGLGIYRRFRPGESNPCHGCGSTSCGSCPVAELKKEMEQKKSENKQQGLWQIDKNV